MSDEVAHWTTKLQAWWESSRITLKSRLLRLGLLGLLLWVFVGVLATWVQGSFWTGAAQVLWWAVAQPMGYGGLVLVVVLIAVALHAYWESREKELAVVPVVLSADDKDAIARMRKLWYDEYGQWAASAMTDLLGEVKEQLGGRYVVDYFVELAEGIKTKATALETAFAFDRPVPLDQVTAAFEALFHAYLRAAEKLYDAHQCGDVRLFVSPCVERFSLVRDTYRKFNDAVVHANNYQGMNRHLKVFAVRGFALSSRKFLGEQPWDGEQPPSLSVTYTS